MSQNYVKYTNSAFPNLTFDVLKKWEVVQNDLEIVFWIPNVGLPQLFFYEASFEALNLTM